MEGPEGWKRGRGLIEWPAARKWPREWPREVVSRMPPPRGSAAAGAGPSALAWVPDLTKPKDRAQVEILQLLAGRGDDAVLAAAAVHQDAAPASGLLGGGRVRRQGGAHCKRSCSSQPSTLASSTFARSRTTRWRRWAGRVRPLRPAAQAAAAYTCPGDTVFDPSEGARWPTFHDLRTKPPSGGQRYMLYNLYKHWCNAEVVRGGLRHISRDGRSSLNISTWVMSQALRYKSFGTSDLLPLATHLGLVNKPLMLEEKDPQSVFMTVMRARGGADAAVQLKAEESSNASINRVERFYMNLTMYIKRGASKACLRLALAARWRACGAPGERCLRRRGDLPSPPTAALPQPSRGKALRLWGRACMI